MVIIRRHRDTNGLYYEIDDFVQYVEALRERGIEAPKVRYRIFIPPENERAICQSTADFESEVKIFFKLSPATEVECEVVDA